MFTFLHTRQSFALIVLMSLLCFFGLAITTVYGAPAQYQPLVGIPGLSTAQGSGLASYLNRLYIITIGIGAIIAFIKIAMAGVKWSMSDVVTDKGTAKEDIKGALLGLAILLIPFIVLNTIYPGLTNLNILKSVGKVDLNQTSRPYGSTGEPGSPSYTGQITENCFLAALPPTPDSSAPGGYRQNYSDSNCKDYCTSVGGVYALTQPSVSSCTFTCPSGTRPRSTFTYGGMRTICEASPTPIPQPRDPGCIVDPNTGTCI